MFTEDIPDYQNLQDTAESYYTSVPVEFWNQFYELFRHPAYKKNELKWIINQCAKLVSIQPSSGWKEEDLLEDARTLVRRFRQCVGHGRMDILMDCFKYFIVPPEFTAQHLNQFLRRNKIGYQYDEKAKKWYMTNTNAKKVFISHASLDKEYVLAFVEFLEDIGLKKEQIFCSSVPEYGIPLGEDIYEYLRSQFYEYDTHVIYMLSGNYYNSAACLNEMGATWILKKEYTTILLPGFQYQEIAGAINAGKIGLKLDTDEAVYRLKELKDNLITKFALPPVEERKWERYVNEFLKKCRQP